MCLVAGKKSMSHNNSFFFNTPYIDQICELGATLNPDEFKQGAMTVARVQKEDGSKRGRRRNH